jgi:hypothetical protein
MGVNRASNWASNRASNRASNGASNRVVKWGVKQGVKEGVKCGVQWGVKWGLNILRFLIPILKIFTKNTFGVTLALFPIPTLHKSRQQTRF